MTVRVWHLGLLFLAAYLMLAWLFLAGCTGPVTYHEVPMPGDWRLNQYIRAAGGPFTGSHGDQIDGWWKWTGRAFTDYWPCQVAAEALNNAGGVYDCDEVRL